MMKLFRVVLICASFFLMLCGVALSFEDFAVVKISGQDKSAVIETPGEGLKVIHPGDMIVGVGKVMEIETNRIVFLYRYGNREETIIFRLSESGTTVERISNQLKSSDVIYSPMSTPPVKSE